VCISSESAGIKNRPHIASRWHQDAQILLEARCDYYYATCITDLLIDE